jgi:hypothetical protein
VENFLTRLEPVSFSRRTLLHGVRNEEAEREREKETEKNEINYKPLLYSKYACYVTFEAVPAVQMLLPFGV